MLIIPAIDLLEGNAVRLTKGLREQATIYSNNPVELIESFVAEGASRIHIVDLDGAFAGARRHSKVVAELCAKSKVLVEVGGGIRNSMALEQCFADGADFAVLGTAAIKHPDFVKSACVLYPGKVIIAVDAKKGMVTTEGWVEASNVAATQLGQQASKWGAGALLYTDVDRDGTHSGPNVEETKKLSDTCSAPVIASGGISSLDDIRELRDAGIPMAVVGRAIYDKHFTVAEAIEVAQAPIGSK